MNKVTVVLATIIASVLPLVPINSAMGYSSPNIEVSKSGSNRYEISISKAPSYSTVDLYYHQSDSDFWNATLNIGTTDRNGKFSTTRTFNSFHPELKWYWYANVGGRNTASITTGESSDNNSGGGYNNGHVLPSTTYNSGTLVLDDNTVYLIYKDQKIGFASESAFLDAGFKWSSVTYGSTYGIPLTFVVSNGNYEHPWGSWIKSGNTIYFVHEDGIIPVSTYSIFLNNGGRPELVVPANRYDMRLEKLSKMKTDDSRVN